MIIEDEGEVDPEEHFDYGGENIIPMSILLILKNLFRCTRIIQTMKLITSYMKTWWSTYGNIIRINIKFYLLICTPAKNN
jgi:hypothetical protein